MTSWLKITYQSSISNLEQWSRYLDYMNYAIQDNLKKAEADRKAITENMSEEELEFFNYYEDEIIEAGRDFPALLFSGFLISWYSFIEDKLINLCKVLNLKKSISITDDKGYKKGIQGAYKFLSEAENYKIDNNHKQELDKIRKIRNLLVHERGRLIPSPNETKGSTPIDLGENFSVYLPIDKELSRYLTQHNLYRIGQNQIIPEYSYCKYLTKLGAELLTKIYEDLDLNT